MNDNVKNPGTDVDPTTDGGLPNTSRRELLKTAMAGAAGIALGAVPITGFPQIMKRDIKDITLRHIGVSYAVQQAIGEQASKDLGFKVEMQNLDTSASITRFVTQPTSVDIADMEGWQIKVAMARGILQGIDSTKIKEFDGILPIFTTGIYEGRRISRQGISPYEVMYTDGAGAGKILEGRQQWLTFLPQVFNADSIGYRPDIVGHVVTEWKDLIDPKFKGRAAILDIPNIGIMDAAQALESRGDLVYGNKGNMTRKEIDTTISALIALKKQGHFRASWSTFEQSVELMASGEVVIQSMWSPAVTAVLEKGIPCVYAPVAITASGKEGYRGWCNGMGLMKHLSGKKLDAAYDYLNWYYSGWQGAYVARHGYYSPVLRTAKAQMSPAEFDYWYMGKPAAEIIKSSAGIPIAKPGAVRDGGSLAQRFSNIACWNTVMDENQYMVQRWNEFKQRKTRAGDLEAARNLIHAGSRTMLVRYKAYFQLAPLCAVLLLFVAAPLFFVVSVSFFRTTGFDTVPAFSFENYASVLGSQLTLQLYLQMVQFAFLTWAVVLLIGFFVAYFLVFHVRNRTVAIGLFLLCTVPFWTSNVIRMISWLPMLGQRGVVNTVLLMLGIIHSPLRFLLYSKFAVVLAYVHLFTIFMIVPVFNAMSRIDRSLFEAAFDAGAGRLHVLWHVVLPLTRSGIALGSIFVVTLVMGDFYVVKVMSGGGSASVVSAMYDDVSTLLFPHASASAVMLLLTLTAMVAVAGRFIDVRRELVAKR